MTPTVQSESVLVSSLDSTLRLMDRGNGKMLRAYKDEGYVNTTYRIRSTLAVHDSVVVSGSEDGGIYAWDVVTGEVAHRLQHDAEGAAGAKSSKRVVSAVACRRRGDQWASAGGDGEFSRLMMAVRRRLMKYAGTIVVWGHDGGA